MKTVTFKIDDAKRRKQFMAVLNRMFKSELNNNTKKVLIKEADIVKFAFKNNGMVRLRKADIRDLNL